jgi:hypothetical protein
VTRPDQLVTVAGYLLNPLQSELVVEPSDEAVRVENVQHGTHTTV